MSHILCHRFGTSRSCEILDLRSIIIYADTSLVQSIRNELHSTADLDKIVQKSKLLLASHDPPLEQGDIDDLDYHLSRTSLDELKLDDRGCVLRLIIHSVLLILCCTLEELSDIPTNV
jgi:hypothetical protein